MKTTCYAEAIVNVCQVVFHLDGLFGADLGALATSNTSVVASLASHCAFLLIDAIDKYTTILATLVA